MVALAESKNGMESLLLHERQLVLTPESAEEKLQQDAARGGDDAHAARESTHGARLVLDGGHVTLESFCFTKASRRKITEAIRCEARLCVFNSIQVRWWNGAERITFKCTRIKMNEYMERPLLKVKLEIKT